jgi:formyl-CoA transferase/CoA:oxalate CoA-transferase
MDAPLAGLLVADLTQNVAGPYCTQILGDMGAQVVKVERPGRGDDARAWAPPYWGEESATFMSVNRNKRSLAVDMKAAEGRAVLERLVARADVLVQSLRAGVIDELGLGWDRARALNPRLVYCSITAFGTEGPLKDRPGYDPLMQAYGGLMSVTGYPGAPARVPVSIVDMGTGMWAVIGILAALRERDRTGRGTHVTTALFDTALAWVTVPLTNYLASGEVPGPQGSGTQMIAPYEAFPSRDGWVMIAAASDALFAKCCGALDLADLARDPRFATNPGRVANRAALAEAIAAATRALDASELLARLQRAGVPSAPILGMDRVAAESQTDASGMLIPAKHPRVDDYRAVGLPVRWDGERPGVARVPPLLGEHTAEVLAELGYDDTAIRELSDRHVIQL